MYIANPLWTCFIKIQKPATKTGVCEIICTILSQDYEEWIESGVLSESHRNILRGLALQEGQRSVRHIMRVVRSNDGARPQRTPSAQVPRTRTLVKWGLCERTFKM